MKTPPWLSFLLYGGLALALAGCGGGGGGSASTPAAVSQITGTNSDSGIRGVAVEGPVQPVQQAGQTNTRPLAGAILTVQPAGGGAEVARATSDTEGNFEIALPPGTYRLVPLPPTPGLPYPIGSPQTVTVATGVFLTLTVNYDTGIR